MPGLRALTCLLGFSPSLAPIATAATLVVGLAASSVAAETATLTFVPDAVPRDLSADGTTFVGVSLPDFAKIHWTEARGLQVIDLGGADGEAQVISADGSAVIGVIFGGDTFRWTPEGGLTFLGTGDCAQTVFPRGIDDSGLVIAGTCGPSFPVPTIWSGDAWSSIDPGPLDFLFGVDMSADGNVLLAKGQYLEESGDRVVRSIAGSVEELGIGLPVAINGDGSVIVGEFAPSGGPPPAFRWTEGGGFETLVEKGRALAVSNDGNTVFGRATSPARWIWTEEDGLEDLDVILPAFYGLDLTDVSLGAPVDMSADGTVLLFGNCFVDGVAGAIVIDLTPVIPDTDSDGDGLLDSWESEGIPYMDADGIEQRYLLDWNQDGVSDADPLRKDIFVEIDAMDGLGLAPTMADLQRVVDCFARAPVENPSEFTGVQLHLQISDTDLPTQVMADPWTEFDALKAEHFGHLSDFEGDPDTIIARLEAKALAYRYCIFGDRIFGSTNGTSGVAEIGGNDFIVSLGLWGSGGGTTQQKAGTFMHEMGHTLGLRHFGPLSEADPAETATGVDKHYNLKPNYYSIMNYNWQTPKSWHSTGSWPLSSLNSGYSAAPLRTIDETDLIETDGLVPAASAASYPAPGFKVPHNIETDDSASPDVKYTILRASAGVDWDGDGDILDALDPFAVDCNRVRHPWPSSPGTTLHGYADWPHLDYDFKDSPYFSDGEHPAEDLEEMTYEDHLALDAMLPPNCDGDIDADDSVDIIDLLEMLAAWGPCTSGVVCVQDLDENGDVGVGDLLVLLANWGPCP